MACFRDQESVFGWAGLGWSGSIFLVRANHLSRSTQLRPITCRGLRSSGACCRIRRHPDHGHGVRVGQNSTVSSRLPLVDPDQNSEEELALVGRRAREGVRVELLAVFGFSPRPRSLNAAQPVQNESGLWCSDLQSTHFGTCQRTTYVNICFA